MINFWKWIIPIFRYKVSLGQINCYPFIQMVWSYKSANCKSTVSIEEIVQSFPFRCEVFFLISMYRWITLGWITLGWYTTVFTTFPMDANNNWNRWEKWINLIVILLRWTSILRPIKQVKPYMWNTEHIFSSTLYFWLVLWCLPLFTLFHTIDIMRYMIIWIWFNVEFW